MKHTALEYTHHTPRVLLEGLPNSTFSNQGGLLEVVIPELSLRISKELAK